MRAETESGIEKPGANDTPSTVIYDLSFVINDIDYVSDLMRLFNKTPSTVIPFELTREFRYFDSVNFWEKLK
jgi:hypothetical protein